MIQPSMLLFFHSFSHAFRFRSLANFQINSMAKFFVILCDGFSLYKNWKLTVVENCKCSLENVICWLESKFNFSSINGQWTVASVAIVKFEHKSFFYEKFLVYPKPVHVDHELEKAIVTLKSFITIILFHALFIQHTTR